MLVQVSSSAKSPSLSVLRIFTEIRLCGVCLYQRRLGIGQIIPFYVEFACSPIFFSVPLLSRVEYGKQKKLNYAVIHINYFITFYDKNDGFEAFLVQITLGVSTVVF